ncbi:MAG TPA: hypothetical protein VM347_44360 [Nonomuraea sp.]|nr:hypothetical protein [Nonomuraea sp.]
MNGMNWLLISSNDGDEEVRAYSDREMVELYTADERADLAAGKSVISHQNGLARHALRSVDMLAAARRVVN